VRRRAGWGRSRGGLPGPSAGGRAELTISSSATRASNWASAAPHAAAERHPRTRGRPRVEEAIDPPLQWPLVEIPSLVQQHRGRCDGRARGPRGERSRAARAPAADGPRASAGASRHCARRGAGDGAQRLRRRRSVSAPHTRRATAPGALVAVSRELGVAEGLVHDALSIDHLRQARDELWSCSRRTRMSDCGPTSPAKVRGRASSCKRDPTCTSKPDSRLADSPHGRSCSRPAEPEPLPTLPDATSFASIP
jgi:hypothetical protein